jgi:sigma-B regulation protein RsbU (phosphoserine phosphatase)
MQALPTDRGLTPGQLILFRPPMTASPADVDVHAVSIPARGFTGDFYYTHGHGPRLWFALGDVAGKGLNAAVVMAMIQEELEQRIGSCATTACDPSVTMRRLHEFLRSVLPPNKFATAVIGHLHDDGRLTITNAGHCPPLIVRKDSTVDEIGSTGPVTGILPKAEWQTRTVRIARGESLILYSDGLAEATNAQDEEFGVTRIRETASGRSAREIGEKILRAVNAHSDGKRADDLTLVILRR